MAKFLDTTGVSYHLQQIINQAQDSLVLISPYLKINERLRQSLEDKDRMKIDIRVVYGKSELQVDQVSWLKSLKSVRTSFCEHLHAKCYLNESEALITSMNLYEFSQVNNQEMGIYVSKAHDSQLYDDIYSEARRLIRISDEVRLSVEKAVETKKVETKKVVEAKGKSHDNKVKGNPNKGFCVRCKKEIPQNPSAPYCGECYKLWKKYENPTYQEKYCHLCAKDYISTFNKPVCFECYKQHKEMFVTKS